MRRTTATTAYLKESMGTALLELMREKPLEKINIEEMTAKADVGRSTYFRYFKSKDEVLSFKIVSLWNHYIQERNLPPNLSGMETYAVAIIFFEFCISIRAVSDMLYATGHQGTILSAYLQIMKPDVSDENLSEYYSRNYTAFGLFGLVSAWIDRGYRESPQQMVEILLQTHEYPAGKRADA